jgi:hypothetical protein
VGGRGGLPGLPAGFADSDGDGIGDPEVLLASAAVTRPRELPPATAAWLAV